MRTVRSKHKRDTIAENLFEQFGSSFHVMELQGDLCFATCESFMRRISADCQTLILNMHRCTTMDDGALSLLIRLNDEFQRNGKRLFVTDYSHLDLLWSYNERHPAFLIFKELDDALYYLENMILESNGYEPKQEPVQLMDQQLLKGLSPAEVNELQKHLLYKCYEEGETIIRKGSVAEDIFFIESGRVVIQDTSDENREFTLAIINSGNSFGEMALLDKQNRSANVKAQTRVTCFVMLYEILDNVESLAGIKIKILTNLGASLSSRLRTANKEIASFT
jgi:CRP-like cAMP-binding protein